MSVPTTIPVLLLWLGCTGAERAGDTGASPSTDSTVVTEPDCVELMAVDFTGAPLASGLEFCRSDGIVRSIAAVSLNGAPPADRCDNVAEYSSCVSNADCGDAPNGRCIVDGPCNCGCVYGCLSDADCGDGMYCDVMTGGSCMPMGCRTDADCEDGEHCRWALAGDEYAWAPYDVTLQCTTPDDTCDVDPDYEAGPFFELSGYDPATGAISCSWTGERFEMVEDIRATDCR